MALILICEGSCRLCDNQKLYDAAVDFYGKWLEEKKEARDRAEHVCLDTVKRLGVREFFESCGWNKEKVDIALVQIIARAIYPYSEYKTVRYLRENSAVCEMFGLDASKITKDTLYIDGRFGVGSFLRRDKVNIWKFYNVIRTVEESFKTLKPYEKHCINPFE